MGKLATFRLKYLPKNALERQFKFQKYFLLYYLLNTFHLKGFSRGTKRLVSVNICSVEGNSADIFDSKVSPGIFVMKEKLMPIIFGRIKLSFWVR